MLKVVLDTNVIISGLNFPGSKPAKLLTLMATGELVNCISKHILEETRRILSVRFSWTKEEVEGAELWLKTFSQTVDPEHRLAIVADEPDNRILECAVAGRADFIISGDHHLTDLENYRWIKIVDPTGFLEIMEAG